jgi:hypothetical protein
MKYNHSVQLKFPCRKILAIAAILIWQCLHTFELFIFWGSNIGEHRKLSFYQTLNPSWDFLLSLSNFEAFDTLNSTDEARFAAFVPHWGYQMNWRLSLLLKELRIPWLWLPYDVEQLCFEVVIFIFYSIQKLQTIFLYAQQSIADRCGHIPEKTRRLISQNSGAFSPSANYTDRATAACRRS